MKKNLILFFLLTFQISISGAQTPGFEWVHTFGGSQGDNGQTITTDSQNNICLTGYFSGTVDFDPGTGVSNLFSGGSTNIFVQKISPSGDLIWAKALPAGSTTITSIAVDPSDYIVIGGSYTGTIVFPTVDSTATISSGQPDAFIVKMNSAGQYLWAKSFGNPNDNEIDPDRINDLKTDAAGNIYSTGHFFGTVDFDPGPGISNVNSSGPNMDIFILKLNPDGNFVWVKRFGASGYDEGVSLTIHQNTLLLTGWFQNNVDFNPSPVVTNMLTTNGYSDMFLTSLTTDGNFNYVKQFGSAFTDKGVAVITDPDGAVYLTGIFDAAIDLDPGTGTNNVTPANGTDFFVVKLAESGDFTWGKTFAGTYYKYTQGLVYHSDNGVMVTGVFSDTVDFNPGSGTGIHTGQDKIFLLYLDHNGNYVWSGSYGSINIMPNNMVTGIAADNLGNVYSTGWFYETVDFDCGPGTAEKTSAGDADIFLLKINAKLLSVNEQTPDDFKLYPNPSNGFITLSAESLNDCRITICNSLGMIVLEKDLSGSGTQLDIQNLSAGSYVVQLTGKFGSQHQTFLKIN